MLKTCLVLIFAVILIPDTSIAADHHVDEESLLTSYAQDLYRQRGTNMSRSAFDLIDNQNRIFYINLISRNSTLENDLLQAFLVGGAVSQHARLPMDLVVVIVEIEFSQKKAMILQADGQCCESLYNNRMTIETFTEVCLQME